MPDIDVHNIIKVNIHSIGTEQTGDSDDCCANRPTTQREAMKQETDRTVKCYTNTNSILKSKNKYKPMVDNQLPNTVGYFLSGPSCDNDRKKSAEITQSLQGDFEDVFNVIVCFDSTFSLQLKLDSKPCQVPPRHVAYTLHKPFEEELKRLQKQDIIAPLGIDETSEWCNSFVLVLKENGKVKLCLDTAQLNQALIRLIHRGSSINNILPKLNNAKYLSLIDVSSGYHNLKLDDKSSDFTMFTCQFWRYRYKQLPFGAAPAGDMFQRKIDEIFKDLPHVFVLWMIY